MRLVMDDRVVLGESLVDSVFTKICFGNTFYFSSMLGLADFSDITILCNRPNVVVNKIF